VNNKSIDWKANKVDEPIVPDVSGMTLRDALYVLENKGLRVNYSGKGRVRSQSLSAGVSIPKDGIIKLTLG
jgi:cell division protein FtsI (penicillin-binding protein 3)